MPAGTAQARISTAPPSTASNTPRYQRRHGGGSARIHQGASRAGGSRCSSATGPLANSAPPRPSASSTKPPLPAPGLPGAHQAEQAQGDEEGDHHVEHQRRREVDEERAGQQDERRHARHLGPLRPQPSAEPVGQHQRAGGEQRRDQPRPPFVDAEHRPAGVHQPEQQRRLVVIGLAIAEGHEEVAAHPHLPGHAGIACLVDRQQRAQQADRQQRSRARRRATGRRLAFDGVFTVGVGRRKPCGGVLLVPDRATDCGCRRSGRSPVRA